jgi:hypothetical protein
VRITRPEPLDPNPMACVSEKDRTRRSTTCKRNSTHIDLRPELIASNEEARNTTRLDYKVIFKEAGSTMR